MEKPKFRFRSIESYENKENFIALTQADDENESNSNENLSAASVNKREQDLHALSLHLFAKLMDQNEKRLSLQEKSMYKRLQ